MNLITRAEWGAVPAKSKTALQTNKWCLHYLGEDVGPTTLEQSKARVKQIQYFHMTSDQIAKGGGSDIAYNWLVDSLGNVFEGRGYGVRSGANGSNYANDNYYAVCYLGGPNDTYTAAAQAAMVELLAMATDVQPHSRFFATACPGNTIREWVANEEYRKQPANEQPVGYGNTYTAESTIEGDSMADAFTIEWKNTGHKGIGAADGSYANLGGPFYGNPLGLKKGTLDPVIKWLGVTAIDPNDETKGYTFWSTNTDGTKHYDFTPEAWVKIQKGEI